MYSVKQKGDTICHPFFLCSGKFNIKRSCNDDRSYHTGMDHGRDHRGNYGLFILENERISASGANKRDDVESEDVGGKEEKGRRKAEEGGPQRESGVEGTSSERNRFTPYSAAAQRSKKRAGRDANTLQGRV